MSGLGRGLGSLIPQRREQVVDPTTLASNGTMEVPLDKILPNPEQPRMLFNHAELEELINSIREHGLIQPLVVTKKGDNYELIAGERRFRAAKTLGLKTVPVVVRSATDTQKLLLALIENIQRQDLNPVEEAKAYERLMSEYDLTQDEIARSVGKARSTVANTIRLLGLPLEIQEAIASGRISMGSARALLALTDSKKQIAFFTKLLNNPNTTTRVVEESVRALSTNSRRDPKVSDCENQLRENFGVRVVVTKKMNRGTITFSFANEDEYQNLTEKLLA